MKTKFFTLTIVLLLVASSCKKGESNETNESSSEKTASKDFFNVEMDIIAQTQDDFTVYYSEDKTNNFDGTKAIWKGVKGGSVPEKVIFDLPSEVIPTNIRLDFGIKKDHKDVIIQNIKIAFYNKSFTFKGSDFLNYFILNDKIITEVDTQKGTIILKGNPTNKEGTYYYPRQELLDQISKLTN
jgi:hypothetical protein